jgi:DNA primase
MLVEAGMLIQVDGKEPYDRFRGRLMIPIRDPRGRTIAVGGRVIGDGEPKYLNSPDTPLFDKGRTLYNLDRAAPASRKSGRVLVVEGYMDVIALAQAGFGEAVAPLGTALTEAQLERLWRLCDVPILCFDGDGPGQKAAIRAAHRALPMIAPGRSLSFVTLPAGLDPDDMVRKQGPAAFEALLKEPQGLADRIWESELAAEPLNTPEQRAGLKQRLNELANGIAEPSVKFEYVAEFRRRFDEQFRPQRPAFVPRALGAKRKPGPWKPPEGPVTEQAKAIFAVGIDQHLAKAVLAGLIRHPDEIGRHMQELGPLRLVNGQLGKLFETVVDLALEDRALDSGRIRTILASSGFDSVASDLFRADATPYSFTQKEADPERARADLDEAIAILVAGPEVNFALAEATANMQARFSDAAFDRQVAMVNEKEALVARLANLMQANEDERTLEL